MKINFWGVRGSIASPGPSTAAVGGNTSCVEVEVGDTRLVLDAGTGLRSLGDKLVREGAVEAHLLLSHYHWDHIQGLPFFVPTYLPSAKITMVGPETSQSMRSILSHQMQEPVFPVPFQAVESRFRFRPVKDGERFQLGDAVVTTARLNHPNGVMAYRIDYRGRSLVYATDTEHEAGELDQRLIRLADGADVFIYDSQYTPDEYPAKKGWGHSTFEVGCALSRAASVGEYVLFHHDPARHDRDVAELERRARVLYPRCTAAREGSSIELPPIARAA